EIARGMLFPGFLPRKESLAGAGGRAAQLILGTIPMLVIAGVIEGFFSPSHAPVALKFLLGGVLFAALIVYLFFSSPAKKADATVRAANAKRVNAAGASVATSATAGPAL